MKVRLTVFGLAMVTLSLGEACDSDIPRSNPPDQHVESECASAVCDDDEPHDAVLEVDASAHEAGGPRHESATCDDLQRSASVLRSEYQRCERDEDCQLVSIDAPCLYAFTCSTSVSVASDLNALRARAASLSTTYRDHCSVCAIASCAGVRAVCDTSNKLCAFRAAPLGELLDASMRPHDGAAPDGGSDGGAQ